MKVGREKKFISPISCIREKFRLQKVGVVEVFLYQKVVSIFHFEQFLTLLIEYLAPLTEFCGKGRRCKILIFSFFQPLWGLVSCPHSLYTVHSIQSQFYFHPTVMHFIPQGRWELHVVKIKTFRFYTIYHTIV